MPQVTPLGALRASFTDKCGRLLAGGKIYTYEENSLTPKTTYADFTGVVPNTNPIVLDRSGEADIFLDGSYRFQIFDRFGTLIHDINNVRDHFKDQIKSYFIENILAAGGLPKNSVADYNYLMQRLAQIAVDKGWDASFVTYNGVNQQKINDGLNSTSELVAIQNPKNGMTVKVKSYSPDMFLKGGGNFTFVANDLTAPNNVNIFAGDGGNWHRLNWKNPSIYDAGIIGNESDNTAKFQKLVDTASENLLSVNLKKKRIKINELDIPSNMHIHSGILDTTSTTWANTYGRGAYMFKTTPRAALDGGSYLDYSTDIHYAPLQVTENIKFVTIHFDAVSTAGMFIKFRNMQFIKCSAKWNDKTLFWMIGGLHGTPVITDTPSSYNLIDPINGWNEHIRIKDSDWDAGYNRSDFSSPFRFNACRDILIEGGSNNAPLGWFVDTYCSKVIINQANVIVTDPNVVLDRINGTSKPEMLALYVGQNSYDVEVNGGLWKNYGDMGLYMEGSSKVRLNGVRSRHTNPNNIAVNAILQPNWRTNTGEFRAMANVAEVYFNSVDFKGAREGIITQAFNITQQSLKDIHVFGGSVEVSTTLAALAITGTNEYTVHGFKAKGALSIGRNNGTGEIKSSGFRNTANYALYVDEMLDGLFPKISNTDFIVGSGPVIYNNGGATRDGKIVGGRVYAEDFVGDVISNGPNASNLSVVDFEYNGDRHIIYPYSLTVGAGAKTSFYISDARYKSGWSCVANIINSDAVGDLDIRANVLSGSIYVVIENKTGAAINALPINIVLKLGTFASRAYPN